MDSMTTSKAGPFRQVELHFYPFVVDTFWEHRTSDYPVKQEFCPPGWDQFFDRVKSGRPASPYVSRCPLPMCCISTYYTTLTDTNLPLQSNNAKNVAPQGAMECQQ